MAEATPLLHDVNETTSHINNANDEFEVQSHPSVKQPAYFRILSIINLVFSTLAVALLIANYIILHHAPVGNYTWGAREGSRELGKWIFVSVVFSFINVLVNFPILLNVIVDVVLTAGIITWVVHLFEGLPDSWWCRIERGYPWPGNPNPEPIYPHPKCEHWKLVVKILMLTAGSFGIIIAIIYLSLLVLRSIAIMRTKFWRRALSWNIPTGTLSFEVSIKLLKQESATPANPAGQTAEGSGSGHGPLYL